MGGIQQTLRPASESHAPFCDQDVPAGSTPALDPQLMAIWSAMSADIRRIADALNPAPPDIVGTPYVAQKLNVTTTWIADLIRRGKIPAACIVPGTGNGRVWKFYRSRIDEWITSR